MFMDFVLIFCCDVQQNGPAARRAQQSGFSLASMTCRHAALRSALGMSFLVRGISPRAAATPGLTATRSAVGRLVWREVCVCSGAVTRSLRLRKTSCVWGIDMVSFFFSILFIFQAYLITEYFLMPEISKTVGSQQRSLQFSCYNCIHCLYN